MPIICRLCNRELGMIAPRHLKYKHNGMTVAEYQEMFPDAPVVSLEAERKRQETMKELWDDPEFKTNFLETVRSPERRAAQSQKAKAAWANPDTRAKYETAFSSSEHSQKMSKLATKQWQNPNIRAKMIKSNIESHNTSKYLQEHSQRVTEQWQDPKIRARHVKGIRRGSRTSKERKRRSESAKKQWEDPKTRTEMVQNIRIAMGTDEYRQGASERAKERAKDPEYIQLLSKIKLEQWQDPEFQRAWVEGTQRRPTRPELELFQFLNDNNYPYVYIGDGSLWIGGKNPDFIWPEQKQLVEMYGSYWHDKSEIEPRTKYFDSYGFRTLIVWDYELDNKERLLAKLKTFHKN